MKPLDLSAVVLKKGLIGSAAELVRTKMIPYQWEILNDRVQDAEPSNVIRNFRIAAGLEQGIHGGWVFQDSDLAKWLEAVAYRLKTHPDEELKKQADQVIDLIGQAQEPDGYLNTYFTIKEPEKKWTNIEECHELYCSGHMLEAAVAYVESTGERKLLDIMLRNIRLIDSILGPEEGKIQGYPGHQEIELALVRLYRVTGEKKHLRLAEYFIRQRGQSPYFFDEEWRKRGGESHWGPVNPNHRGASPYHQAHKPVLEQNTAVGHAVRMMYMTAAMTDIAFETGDAGLADACRRLWDDITRKQMYVTGGVGSSGFEECFTFPYDLPNDRAYSETCAAIGLVFWSRRMLQLERKGEYGDVMEQALLNTVLAGMSLEGREFFYVNPLEVLPQACDKRHDLNHVKGTRQKWFGCACCPPNLARLLSSIGQYMYSEDEEGLQVHLYGNSRVDWKWKGDPVSLDVETEYPVNGEISLRIGCRNSQDFSLDLRIPGWCRTWEIRVNGTKLEAQQKDGYLSLKRIWKNGDRVDLNLTMEILEVYSKTQVRDNLGRVALQYGPLIYCLEEKDNGTGLASLMLEKKPEYSIKYKKDLLGGVNQISARALRRISPGENLYSFQKPDQLPQIIHLVPYYAWSNRGPGEMLVWIGKKDG